MSPAGYAHAIWREKREETGPDPVVEVKSARKLGAGTWTAPFRMTNDFGPGSTAPVAEGEPQIAINADGERMMAWLLAGTKVSMSERTSFSDLGSISAPAQSIIEATAHVELPEIALDGAGLGVAAWRSWASSEGFRVKVATTSSLSGGWSSPQTVAELGEVTVGTELDVAAAPAGAGTVVWSTGSTVHAASRPAGGTFAPSVPISSPANPGFLEPRVTTSPSGDAIAAWTSPDMTSTHIAVAVDDVTPPEISFTPPVPVALGNATGFNAVATDAWSPTSLTWDFGDGATASGASVSHVYATPGAKTATVTATDAAGNSATATAQVAVLEGAAVIPPPIIPTRTKVHVTPKPVVQPWAKIAAAKALKLRCKLDVSGTCSVTASVGAGVAKRLGLKGRPGKPVTIGRGSAQVRGGRFATVKVKLKSAALTAIAAASRPVPVSFAVKGTAGGHDDGGAKAALKIPGPELEDQSLVEAAFVSPLDSDFFESEEPESELESEPFDSLAPSPAAAPFFLP